MKRFILNIVCSLFCLGVMAQANPAGGMTVNCGTWITLCATPHEDYHFVEWSDGSTDSLRQVEVLADATYIAFFAENCVDLPDLPVVTPYDWIIMLNMTKVHELGFYFNPEDVSWYRVVGEPDKKGDPDGDDVVVGTGYYLTLDKNLWGTGDYYAQIHTTLDSPVTLCSDILRSVLVHFAGSDPNHMLALMPNATRMGGQLKLVGLNPNEETTLQVYTSSGQLVNTFTASGEPTYLFQAAYVSGCYHVRVVSPTVDTVLKYIVYAR